jgi:SSS family solute:Na+ symporter
MQGVYRPWFRPASEENDSLRMSRITNVVAVVLSIGAAYVALTYQSMMEYMQMVFATFNAPLLVLVVLAAVAPRSAARGGVAGFSFGLASTVLHQIAVRVGFIHYGSQMSANFYSAILGFIVATVSTLLVSELRREVVPLQTQGKSAAVFPLCFTKSTIAFAIAIAIVCVVLNLWFR